MTFPGIESAASNLASGAAELISVEFASASSELALVTEESLVSICEGSTTAFSRGAFNLTASSVKVLNGSLIMHYTEQWPLV